MYLFSLHLWTQRLLQICSTSLECSKWSLKSSIDVLTHKWEMGIDVLNDF